ncbi:Acg family FMN-binding oxidoreductase [Nocardioides sp. SYSU DS0651]|uniref:Acg family FMN-binding oxidoreductase n=1 Tax=Nocardioides sp. SYSU DS0651 TaxID=3415955 RepID=UPI003F4BBA2D
MAKGLATSDRNASTDVVTRLVKLACHAPSVHNTQPWLWEYDGSRLALRADMARHLPAEDPDGRNLTISCGAALHHLQFAARTLGWATAVWRLPDVADLTVLAHVAVGRSDRPEVSSEDLDLLRRRCTDRRRFTAWPVPDDRLQALCDLAEPWGVRAQPITSMSARFRLEVLANRAVSYVELDGRRLREQARWVGRAGDDGIPVAVLPDSPEPLRARSRFRAGVLEDARMALGGGDAVVALGGDSDDVGSWLRTGEALSALWLEATRQGLSIVPLSQPIEVETTRQELEDAVLDGGFRPHILLRVGWQAIGRSELPRTPRRPVGEVLRA